MRRLFLLILCLLLVTASVSAAGSQITSLTEEVTVDAEGASTVSVTAKAGFSGNVSRFVLPLPAGAEVLTVSGGVYTTERIDGVSCLVFANEAGFVAEQTFACTYRLPRSVQRADGTQTFSISLIEKGWELPVQSFHLHLQFPEGVTLSARPVWNSSYYGDVIDNYLSIQLSNTAIDASSVAPLKDRETLRMSLQFPDGAFRMRHQPGSAAAVSRIGLYLFALAALLYWFFALRGRRLLLPAQQASVGIEATAGELPCQLYGQTPDLAATLAHWGNLGYLAIRRTRRGKLLLYKKMEMGNERKPAERRLFQAIFGKLDTRDPLTAHFRTLTAPALRGLRAGWLRRCFPTRSGSPRLLHLLGILAGLFLGLLIFDLWLPARAIRWFLLPVLTLLTAALCYLVQRALDAMLRPAPLPALLPGGAAAVLLLFFGAQAGILPLALLCLLLQAFCALSTLFGGRRTPAGEELVCQQLGLRRHLRRGAETPKDGQYFYQTLPFAEVLGVGRAFSRQFGKLEPCLWLTDDRRTPANAAEFYTLYSEVASALRGGTLFNLTNPQQAVRPPKPRRRKRASERTSNRTSERTSSRTSDRAPHRTPRKAAAGRERREPARRR